MFTVSWLDVVMVVVLGASIAFGYHQGLLRQVVLLLALYVSTVVAAQYHYPAADMIKANISSASIEMSRVVAFVGIVIVATFVLTLGIWTAYRETKLPTVVAVDAVGGVALGVLIGIAAVNLLVMIGWYALEAPWPEGSDVKYYLQMGLYQSGLQEAFRSPLPLLQATLRPWVPAGVPFVLDS